jgi:hypothetical protein
MALNKEVFGQKVQVNTTNQNLSVIELTLKDLSNVSNKPAQAVNLSSQAQVLEISPQNNN